MCWLLVIFTALLCSELSRAYPSGSGNDTGGTGDTEPQKDVDPMQIQKELAEAMKEVELAERLADEANSRESRGLLKKVAFLAGMRVGGLVQSSGTLAASNSLRVFGKVVNSALSVSYGTVDELTELPTVDVIEPSSNKVAKEAVRPVVTQSIREAEEQAHRKIKANFIESHNQLVDRANAKFLRMSRAQDTTEQTEINQHFNHQ